MGGPCFLHDVRWVSECAWGGPFEVFAALVAAPLELGPSVDPVRMGQEHIGVLVANIVVDKGHCWMVYETASAGFDYSPYQ